MKRVQKKQKKSNEDRVARKPQKPKKPKKPKDLAEIFSETQDPTKNHKDIRIKLWERRSKSLYQTKFVNKGRRMQKIRQKYLAGPR
jgi:hypothetical protein